MHSKVHIIAAGNKATDNAIVNEIGTAMQSRVITMELATAFKAWKDNVAYKEGYDPLIIGYLEFNKDQLSNFNPDHNDHTFACPRTWEFVNKLISNMKSDELTSDNAITRMLIAGAVGTAAAFEFLAFCEYKNKLPSITTILKDPENAPMPSELAEQWAVAAYVAREFTAVNGKALIKYIQRLPMDMQVIPYRIAANRYPAILEEVPEIDDELMKLVKYL